jgi:hypothetical protein
MSWITVPATDAVEDFSACRENLWTSSVNVVDSSGSTTMPSWLSICWAAERFGPRDSQAQSTTPPFPYLSFSV